MTPEELKVGAVVEKKSGDPFSTGAQTAVIREIESTSMSEEPRVWLSTGMFMYEYECLLELNPLFVPGSGIEDSTSGQTESPDEELTGGSVDYYKAWVVNPTSGGDPYELEVNDFAEAFELNYAEATIVKAIARLAQLRRDQGKPGSTARYEAEKQHFFAERVLIQNT